MFIDELKNIIIDATLIKHNKNEFDNLFNSIKNYSNLIVVMESTSIYHLPVENYFRSKGIDTVVMNPKLVKQFKDTLNKSKTDKLDCFKIARCYLGTIDNFYYKNDEYFMYNPLARQYWSLFEGQTRLKNRYKQLIEIVFPEFNLVFNDLYDDLDLNFIHDFPHPILFVNTRFDDKHQFVSFLGIDSVTSQSGISAYHGAISKTGCKFGRTILFNVVTIILQISAHANTSNSIYLFFRKKQSEGKHHYKCIIACETKLYKIIYKLCSSNCLYENK